ncbi:MAG: hypothetical protein PHV17_07040 [Candidatus Omnitrophica bacterium]|nr:hypothetical protein [Candidatus Omnitrophota bacterium]
MKRASAIAEYAILVFIVISFLSGVYYLLKRHVQARVKHESDVYLQKGFGLEWASRVTFSGASSDFDRYEQVGGDIVVDAESKSSSVTLTAPPPSLQGWSIMEHKSSSIHVQDPAMPPPQVDYPSHQRSQKNEEEEYE